MPQGKVVTFLRSLPGQAAAFYWLPGQLIANSKMYKPEEPLHKKFEFFFRRKAIWEMAALSATICGIEFCYAAETAYVSPILRLLGTPTYFTSMVWGCSPILGVFITPIFGSLSDACNSRFGRRRPFIVALSFIVLAGLALIATAVSVAQQTESSFMANYSESTSTASAPSSPFSSTFDGKTTLSTRRRRTTTLSPAPPWTETDETTTTTESTTSSSTTTTTTTTTEPTTTTEEITSTIPVDIQNLEEAVAGREDPDWDPYATTPTPPTSAAVHRLPIGMAILGVILMDFGCDASQSPCRTYLLDVCLPEDHRLGLRTFTVSAGLGGSIGYLMGGLDFGPTNGDSAAIFFQHIRTVYTIIGVLFILFVCSTIFVFTEPTLEEWRDLQAIATASQEAAQKEMDRLQRQGLRGSYRKLNRKSSRKLQSGLAIKSHPKQPERLPLMATKSCSDAMQQFQIQRDAQEIEREDSEEQATNFNNYNTNQPQQDVSRTKSVDKTELDRLNAPKIVANEPKEPTFLIYLRSIRHMPRSIGLVCLTNYFSWMSLVCYSLYFTDFVGEIVFDGDATAAYGMPKRLLYEDGVRFGACGMSLYSFTCCIYSLFAEKIYKKIGLRFTYALGPTLYSLGMVTLILVRAKWAAIILSATAGLMYSTLFTMPYILIGKYHSHQMFEKLPNDEEQPQQQQQQHEAASQQTSLLSPNGQQPQSQPQHQQLPKPGGEVRGLGTDIALVSSMVFLAQFTVSLSAGPLSHATDSPIVVFVMGALAAAMTAILSLRLYYPSKS